MKIGVTGHQQRDGISWPWVETRIERYLAGKPGLQGYSSLAAGTDQIFADVVLAKGGKLISVVPMDDYRAQFESDALQRYDRLSARAEVVELKSNKRPERAFLDAGRWIVREVEYLIAVWDGEPAEGAGGTGDVVKYALSLRKPVHHINPMSETVADL